MNNERTEFRFFFSGVNFVAIPLIKSIKNLKIFLKKEGFYTYDVEYYIMNFM